MSDGTDLLSSVPVRPSHNLTAAIQQEEGSPTASADPAVSGRTPQTLMHVLEEQDANEEALRRAVKGGSTIAFFNFFKSLFGAGILSLSNAVSYAGLPLGMGIGAIVAATVYASMVLLLRVRDRAGVQAGKDLSSYGAVAAVVYGPRGEMLVQYCVSFLQILFCTGFVIVLTATLNSVWEDVSVALWSWGVFPFLVVMSWLPFLKSLWFTSFLGLIVYFVGVLGLSIVQGARDYDQPGDALRLMWGGVPHFFGVSLYALEGIGLVIPTAGSLSNPKRANVVIGSGVFAYAVLAFAYAGFMYMSGMGSCSIITKCLDNSDASNVVRVALAVALIFTYPVYLIVPSTHFEQELWPKESLEAYLRQARAIVAAKDALSVASGGVLGGDADTASSGENAEGSAHRRSAAGEDDHTSACPSGSGTVSDKRSPTGASSVSTVSTFRVSRPTGAPDVADADAIVLAATGELHTPLLAGTEGHVNPHYPEDSVASFDADYSISGHSNGDGGGAHSGAASHAAGGLWTMVVGDKFIWKQRAMRSLLCFFSCLVSSFKPNFSVFAALVGSSLLVFVGFIFPAALYMHFFKEDLKAMPMAYAGLTCFVLLGVAAAIIGTYEAMRQMLYGAD